MHHILIIDDDHEIRSLLAKILIKAEFIVSTAQNAAEARELMAIFQFDLLILDVMMPGESGVEFLKSVQNHPPIIMLTAMADVDDRINGLELGAEDYLAKPFDVKELILRMRKLLDRSSTSKRKIIFFGKYVFHLNNITLLQDGELIHLTTNEGALLKLLAINQGEIISREFIVAAIGGDITERTVDAQIARLRSKIEANPKNPLYLHTIRNKGYVLRGSI